MDKAFMIALWKLIMVPKILTTLTLRKARYHVSWTEKHHYLIILTVKK